MPEASDLVSGAITLCVCTYNRYDDLVEAVASLQQQTLAQTEFRLLVIDNSPDVEKAEQFGFSLSEIENLEYIVVDKPGLSNARNVALEVAGTEFIAFLDDDALASRNWAEALLDAFGTYGPRCSMVAGPVDPIWSGPRPPWLHDKMLLSLSIIDWGGDAPRFARTGEVLVGANMAFRVEALKRIGGFNTSLGRKGGGAVLSGNEDTEAAEALRSNGDVIVYAPAARVGHKIAPERLRRDWFRRRMAWQAVSDFQANPEKHVREIGEQWRHVAAYFNKVPPLQRTMRGLYHDTDDPDLFNDQLGIIYLTTIGLLAGFAGVDVD